MPCGMSENRGCFTKLHKERTFTLNNKQFNLSFLHPPTQKPLGLEIKYNAMMKLTLPEELHKTLIYGFKMP